MWLAADRLEVDCVYNEALNIVALRLRGALMQLLACLPGGPRLSEGGELGTEAGAWSVSCCAPGRPPAARVEGLRASAWGWFLLGSDPGALKTEVGRTSFPDAVFDLAMLSVESPRPCHWGC